AQSLSTFSGHMRSIIRIVDAAAPGTLVLLDELGAGTDPTEGSALAQALLDFFIKAGALGAATPPHAEPKAHAHPTPAAPTAAGRDQRVGRVRHRDAQPHLQADDRPPGSVAGVRDRGAARPAGGARRGRAIAAVRGTADVRGDAGPDQRGGIRDRGVEGARARG